MSSYTFMTTYVFLTWHICVSLFMPISSDILLPMKCYIDSLKYFTFVTPISSFTSMISLISHISWSYLFLASANEVVLQFSSLIVLSNLWPLMDSSFGRDIPFSLLILISFENYTHTYIYINLIIPLSGDNLKYFSFVSHIGSSTSMNPLVFHVWQSYLFFCKYPRHFATIHKHFIFDSNTSCLTFMTTYWFLVLAVMSFSTLMPIFFCNCKHLCINTKTLMPMKTTSNILHLWPIFLLLDLWSFSIPCLAVTFVFYKCYEDLTAIHNSSYLIAIFLT